MVVQPQPAGWYIPPPQASVSGTKRMYIFKASSACLTFSPVTESGQPIGEWEDERPLNDVDVVFVTVMNDKLVAPMPDRLCVGHSRYLALRNDVVKQLTENVTFPRELVQRPLVVREAKGATELSSDYRLLFSTKEYDVLNLGKSEFNGVKNANGDDVVVSVKKWCVLPRKIPTIDAFRVLPNDWMVTDRFKDFWERNGFTGAEFSSVVVTD